jgi:Na+:H+ antiporter, NhaA family
VPGSLVGVAVTHSQNATTKEQKLKKRPAWLHSNRPIVRRVARPVVEFLDTEVGGGIVLVVATVVAMLWANSPWSQSYFDLWEQVGTVGLGSFDLSLDLRHWINDGLMTLFFFVVAMEIKREFVDGELSDPRKAALPALAAVGGMIAPALVYLALASGPGTGRGWGIPIATDIAFAVGVLALIARNAPPAIRVFLLTLAIVDDIGAILVIAIFYSSSLSLTALAISIGSLAAIVLTHRAGIRPISVYVALGIASWVAMVESGIHPTISGVVVGLLTPARPLRGDDEPLTEKLTDRLHPYTSFVIVPLFALANAGLRLSPSDITDALTSKVGVAVAAGLVVGKIVGVTGVSFIAIKSGLATLPNGIRFKDIASISALAGIGFTVSIFITNLAFENEALQTQAKVGIIAASILAAATGAGLAKWGPNLGETSTENDDRG